jgi:hypothetical protein
MTPRNKKIIEDSERENIPILVFTAKDKLAMNTLADYYHSSCLTAKCNPEFMADLNARIAEFRTWQKANPDRVKVPD